MKVAFLSAVAALSFGAANAADDRGLSTLPAGEYVMDKTHGYVTFSYSHLGFSNPILRFNDIDATVMFDADKVTASKVMVEIDPASIDSAVPKFDGHLVGKDFFDVANHPEITFVSTGMEMNSDYTGTLTGNLTVKGITKPVTLAATLNKAGPHPFTNKPTFGVSAVGKIDRTEFDLGAYAPNVGAEVTVSLEVEFSKK